MTYRNANTRPLYQTPSQIAVTEPRRRAPVQTETQQQIFFDWAAI